MTFDPTISLGNLLTFIGYVGSIFIFFWRFNASINDKFGTIATDRSNKELYYSQRIATIESDVTVLKERQGFFSQRQTEDTQRHDREMKEIKELLKEISRKLDDKADKED